MLRYFQNEGMVKLSRGMVAILGPGEAGGAEGLTPPLWTQGCFPAFALQMSWVMVPMGQ